MKKFFIVLFSLFAFAFSPAIAAPKKEKKQESPWFLVTATATATKTFAIYGKHGSLEHSKNNQNVDIVIALFRTVDGKGNVVYDRKYVPIDHCISGMGRITTLNLDGSFSYENDFVLDGAATVADTVASAICRPVLDAIKTIEKQV